MPARRGTPVGPEPGGRGLKDRPKREEPEHARTQGGSLHVPLHDRRRGSRCCRHCQLITHAEIFTWSSAGQAGKGVGSGKTAGGSMQRQLASVTDRETRRKPWFRAQNLHRAIVGQTQAAQDPARGACESDPVQGAQTRTVRSGASRHPGLT